MKYEDLIKHTNIMLNAEEPKDACPKCGSLQSIQGMMQGTITRSCVRCRVFLPLAEPERIDLSGL